MDPQKTLPNLSDHTPYYAAYGNLLLIEHPPEMGLRDLYFIFQKPGVIAFDRWNVWSNAAGTTVLAPVVESPGGGLSEKTTKQAVQGIRDLCPRLHELCVVESKDAPCEVEWIQYLASCEKLAPRRIQIRDKKLVEKLLKRAVADLPEDKRNLANCLEGDSYDVHRFPIHETIRWDVFNDLWHDSFSHFEQRNPVALGHWSDPATIAITEVTNVLEGTLRCLLKRAGELNIPQEIIHKQVSLGAEQAVANKGSGADVRIGKIHAVMDLMDEHGSIGVPVAKSDSTHLQSLAKAQRYVRSHGWTSFNKVAGAAGVHHNTLKGWLGALKGKRATPIKTSNETEKKKVEDVIRYLRLKWKEKTTKRVGQSSGTTDAMKYARRGKALNQTDEERAEKTSTTWAPDAHADIDEKIDLDQQQTLDELIADSKAQTHSERLAKPKARKRL